MILSGVALAVPAQIGDNTRDAEFEIWAGAAGVLSRDETKNPVWGTADKTLLADLIDRSRRGDLQAMESIYALFKRPVFGLAYRHAMNQPAAEDLLQDVFLKVFSHLQDVRDVETFPGWVFRIALNTCYSYLRQKKVHNERDVTLTDLEGTIQDESPASVESDLKEPLERAIESLPPRLKSVFVLHDVQGYKHQEIARLIGCSVGTSKSQLFKARAKLRAALRARKIV